METYTSTTMRSKLEDDLKGQLSNIRTSDIIYFTEPHIEKNQWWHTRRFYNNYTTKAEVGS
jgi:hypothetical protein